MTIQNNVLITDGGTFTTCGDTTTCTVDHNQQWTTSTANTNGFTSSETYPFSPPNASAPTIRAGLNLTSSCVGLVVSLCNDTTVGVGYDTTNHKVISPNRTSLLRPNSAWDEGAYQFPNNSAPSIGMFAWK